MGGKLESQKSNPLRNTSENITSQPPKKPNKGNKRKVHKRGFTFTGEATVNDRSTSHQNRLSNIHHACDNELENAKQEHLHDSSLLYKSMYKETQDQLGGTRGIGKAKSTLSDYDRDRDRNN